MEKHHFVLILPDAGPTYTTSYRAEQCQRMDEKVEVDETVKVRVAETVATNWASQIVFLSKTEGCFLYCVHYRRLNSVTERDSYPFSRKEKSVASSAEAHELSTLGVNSGDIGRPK